MKLVLTLCIFLFVSGAYAAERPASEASIRQLIEVTQSRKLMDNMLGQMDSIMQNAMKQAAGSTTLTVQQQAVLENMQKKMIDLLVTEMNWEKLEPDFIAIYQKSFTEQEVAGMLDFYRTEAGQALINKMPMVLQYSMEMMQTRMSTILPKLQQIQKESLEQMRACRKEGR